MSINLEQLLATEADRQDNFDMAAAPEVEAVDYGGSEVDMVLGSPAPSQQDTSKFSHFSVETLKAIDTSLEGDTPSQEMGGNATFPLLGVLRA